MTRRGPERAAAFFRLHVGAWQWPAGLQAACDPASPYLVPRAIRLCTRGVCRVATRTPVRTCTCALRPCAGGAWVSAMPAASWRGVAGGTAQVPSCCWRVPAALSCRCHTVAALATLAIMWRLPWGVWTPALPALWLYCLAVLPAMAIGSWGQLPSTCNGFLMATCMHACKLSPAASPHGVARQVE